MCLVGVISYPGLSKTAHSSTMVTQHELRMASAEPRNEDALWFDDTEKWIPSFPTIFLCLLIYPPLVNLLRKHGIEPSHSCSRRLCKAGRR